MSRHRVVILGSSWGAMSCLRAIPKRSPVDITVVSPSTHFLFTPMLASSAVGTVNFRNIIEPVRRVIEGRSNARFIRAECLDIDTIEKTATCIPADQRHMGAHFPRPRAASNDINSFPSPARAGAGDVNNDAEEVDQIRRGHAFELPFDSLVVATGMSPETFGTPGVEKHASFLRTIDDARAVRRRIVDSLELASVPTATLAEVRTLAHFVVVGGGPTGVEFCGELHDLIDQDLRRLFPARVVDEIRVTLIEPSSVLSAFDANLKAYTVAALTKRGIRIIRGAVTKVEDGTLWVKPVPSQVNMAGPAGLVSSKHITSGELPLREKQGLAGMGSGYETLEALAAQLSDGAHHRRGGGDLDACDETASGGARAVALPFGACVWSTGLCASPLVRKLGDKHARDEKSGRLLVDNSLRLVGEPSVYAIGDCSVFEGNRLVQTAQVAAQEGAFAGRNIALRLGAVDVAATRGSAAAPGGISVFRFVDRGMLAYIGRFEALVNTNLIRFKGHFAWLFWRSAYLTMLLSWRSKFGTAWDWLMTLLFGRDVSRF